MTTQRDPRVDPKPGDVVRGSSWSIRRVLGTTLDGKILFDLYYSSGRMCVANCEVTRNEWRALCATATIVKTAEEGGMDE